MEQQKGNETAGRGGAGTDSLDAETACHGDAEQVGKTHKVVPKRVSLKLWEEKKGMRAGRGQGAPAPAAALPEGMVEDEL